MVCPTQKSISVKRCTFEKIHKFKLNKKALQPPYQPKAGLIGMRRAVRLVAAAGEC